MCKIQPPDLLFLFAFISFYTVIIFHKLLELHSKISEKKYFCHKFAFLTDLLRPPPP